MSRAGREFEMLKVFLPGRRRKMSCLPWAVQPGPAMLEGAGGHRWVQGPEGPREFGDQRMAAVKVMSLPLHKVFHVTLNTLSNTIVASIALPWGCAVLLTCTGQSNAALSGKGLSPG